MKSNHSLLSPSPEALTHSEKLIQVIRDEITKNESAISFARFMELVLYAPGLGYYSAGSHKLGEQGDFITAPEISPLFAQCLAKQCEQILRNLQNGKILEIGAGSGVMAADLLLELERLDVLPEKYFILEVSADLRDRQSLLLQTRIPHLFSRIEWLNQIPSEKFMGIILANEVLDAMPVHCFRYDKNAVNEVYVAWEENKFIKVLREPRDEIKIFCETLTLPDRPYTSEVNLFFSEWLSSITACLEKGLILLIDYGFPHHEYYHADRHMGTLMCHYRHHAHCDPFVLVGLQDITAHVDFTRVAESAEAVNLHVAGFTNQAAFLLNCGLLDFFSGDGRNSRHQLEMSQAIQKLTSPAEMGELFKVMALTRELNDIELVGFAQYDQRGRL
jgi:SAM-dependent MidA family methyltransferase